MWPGKRRAPARFLDGATDEARLRLAARPMEFAWVWRRMLSRLILHVRDRIMVFDLCGFVASFFCRLLAPQSPPFWPWRR